jgi:hypothetical protein
VDFRTATARYARPGSTRFLQSKDKALFKPLAVERTDKPIIFNGLVTPLQWPGSDGRVIRRQQDVAANHRRGANVLSGRVILAAQLDQRIIKFGICLMPGNDRAIFGLGFENLAGVG